MKQPSVPKSLRLKPGHVTTPSSLCQRRAVFTNFVEEVAANPNIFVGEVAVVVLLSGLFEAIEKWIRKGMNSKGDETGQKILDSLFREITGLGFIGLFVYLVTRSGVADTLALDILGEVPKGENPLAESFETVHIMIFLLLVVLLFQAAAVLTAARNVTERWDEYERSRSFGTAADSLESQLVDSGYLERVAKAEQPRGQELSTKKRFTYGDTWWDRLTLRRSPINKLLMWRAIRHDFLFPADADKNLKVKGLSNPMFFSFERYLFRQMGKTVLSVVKVGLSTWVLTLLILVPLLYYCITLDLAAVEVLQFAAAWALLGMTALLTFVLEEETYKLTPGIPEDARQILRLFAGTSSSMTRRAATFGEADESLPSIGELAVPGLGDVAEMEHPTLSPCPAERGEANFLSTRFLTSAFRTLAFWQALIVTSLAVSYLSKPPENGLELGFYIGSWLEWPIFLFWVVPLIIRRMTLRNSVGQKADLAGIRQVSLQTKEGLLRDYMMIVQMVGLESRATRHHEPWTTESLGAWTQSDADGVFQKGLGYFRELPAAQKLDIWKIFASWDANNDEKIDVDEVAEVMAKLGFSSCSHSRAKNLLRLIAFDGCEELTWRKFKALAMLATEGAKEQVVEEDMDTFFGLIDADGNEDITVFELAEWSKRSKIDMNADDFVTLLYITLTRQNPPLQEASLRAGYWLLCPKSLHEGGGF